jgi:hypothetical protein
MHQLGTRTPVLLLRANDLIFAAKAKWQFTGQNSRRRVSMINSEPEVLTSAFNPIAIETPHRSCAQDSALVASRRDHLTVSRSNLSRFALSLRGPLRRPCEVFE